ncbi:MAG: hypothetical protein GX237_05885 [Clostridiales bacterium]|nr:hypothetical protein [Clostridiales bacterium]
MSKKTRLGDDASIYQPKAQLSEKEKLKDMPIKKRFAYLWEYYKIHALIIVAVIGFSVYIIHEIRTPKADIDLYAAIINNPIETEVWDDYEARIMEYLELDPVKSKIFFNDMFVYNSTPDYEMSARQAFVAYVTTANIDLVIAPQSEFSNYVINNFLTPLSDQLPTDLYGALTNNFYLATTEDNPKVSAYGIYVDDTKLFKDNSRQLEDDPFIIGIVANSTHKENAVKFIRYIFAEN